MLDIEPVSSSGPDDRSEVEQKEEELCEHERYFALYHDEDTATEREGNIAYEGM